MIRLKISLVSASLALLISAPAQEETSLDPERLASSRELIQLLEITKAMDAAFESMGGMMDQMIDQQGLKGEQAKQAKKAAEAAMQASVESAKEIDWVGIFGEVYAEVFTVEELNDLIEFYKTPAGQKYIEKQPELQSVTMAKMQGVMGAMVENMQEKMAEAVKKEESAGDE